MSESEGNSSPEGASAAPGCFILGAIITVFGGLIVLYIVVFFIQTKAIADFTEDSPAEIALFSPEDSQVAQLREKLALVKSATGGGRRERVLFSKDDLNTLIATASDLEDFRGTTRVERISDRGIEARMTRPMNRAPLTSMQRHLNAVFTLQPELRRRTVAFRVKNISPSRGTIPEQFIKVTDTMNLFQLDPENPNIKPYIPRLSRIYTEAGNLVVETGPPANDQSPLPE
ncbi:MAG: hypothetical protein P1V20_07930 [Verrucomicrobiales bacterium]|nr:hypothetical protein [Verrucomicrobiales bacterium]